MRRCILILLICFPLAAGKCLGPEYVYLAPDIPGETLKPCPISDRQVRTVNDLAKLATEHRRTAECANGKIETVAQIMSAPASGPR